MSELRSILGVQEVSPMVTLRDTWLALAGTPEQAIAAYQKRYRVLPNCWARNPLPGLVLVGPVSDGQR